MSTKTLQLFIKISQERMYNHYLPKLVQSIEILDAESLWMKEAAGLNSVGGVVMHICEHVDRNAIKFSNPGHPGFGQGIEDHFPALGLSPQQLIQTASDVFNKFHLVMVKLLEKTPDEIDMHSLYHLVEHTGYHLGQIVDRCKRTTQKPFNFCQNGINEQNLKVLIEKG